MTVAAQLTPAPSQHRVLRRTAAIVRRRRPAFVAALAVGLLTSVVEMLGPLLVGRGIDAVVAGDRERLAVVAGGYAVLTLAMALARAARGRLSAAASEGFLLDLRELVSARLLAQRLRFFDRHHAGELVTRATTDVDRLSRFVRDGLPSLVEAVLLLVVTAVVLLASSWQLALVTLVYVPGLVIAVRRYHGASLDAYAGFADAEASTTAAVGETIAARSLLRGLGATGTWSDRMAASDRDLLTANDGVLRADNRLSILGFWQQLTLAAVVLAGGLLSTEGAVSVGTIATFALALRQLFGPLDSLAWIYADAQQARTNLARLLEVIELEHPPPVEREVSTSRGDGAVVAFEDVTYSYDGRTPALRGVTFRLQPGERVALVGATGSGKSTAAKLAAGLLEPDDGRVDLATAAVGLIPQEGLVIRGTLADNLRLVPGEHTDEDLRAAVDRAGLDPWVAQLPLGLAQPFADRGANLSSGERQLVALCRAALADPDLLILDEATADVDARTERLVADALDRLTVGRTVLVVAHRPATARRCDRTITLERGAVVL